MSFSSFVVVLSVLLVACDAYHVSRVVASRTSRLHSNQQPTTNQENWKQSMKTMVNLGVAGSAFFGLKSVAMAVPQVAPVKSRDIPAAPVNKGPVIDAEGFTVSDSGLRSRDTKVFNFFS